MKTSKQSDFTWTPNEPKALNLSFKQARIVQILAESSEPMTGYQIAKASNGDVSLTGIYVQLDSLDKKGVTQSRWVEMPAGTSGQRRVPRRFVELTKRGSLRREADEKTHDVQPKFFPEAAPV